MGINRWDDPKGIDDVEGGRRRILGATEEMMLVHYTLPEGAVGDPHSHEETTQASFVIEGALELTGEFSSPIEAGDSYIIPPKTEHGIRVIDDCKVIDAFSPPLEKYR